MVLTAIGDRDIRTRVSLLGLESGYAGNHSQHADRIRSFPWKDSNSSPFGSIGKWFSISNYALSIYTSADVALRLSKWNIVFLIRRSIEYLKGLKVVALCTAILGKHVWFD